MLINARHAQAPPAAKTPAAPTSAAPEFSPAWLDRLVPAAEADKILGRRVLIGTVGGAITGVAAGTVLTNLGHAAGWGALGVLAGAGAGLAVGMYQLSARQKADARSGQKNSPGGLSSTPRLYSICSSH